MREKATSLALIFFLSLVLLPIPAKAVTTGSDGVNITTLHMEPASSVDFVRIGLIGSLTTDILTPDLDGDGEKEAILGTSKGVYIISSGTLQHYIPTSSFVIDIALLDDVTGDGQPDIAVAVGDIYFPNIRCYNSATSKMVWQFAPRQDAFIDNLLASDPMHTWLSTNTEQLKKGIKSGALQKAYEQFYGSGK